MDTASMHLFPCGGYDLPGGCFSILGRIRRFVFELAEGGPFVSICNM